MHSYIVGKIVYTNGRSITLESNYHGYYVWVKDPQEFQKDSVKRVYVHKTLSKEYQEDLYGFLNWEEKMVFLDLIGLQGVGPKTAMSILRCADINLIRTAAANSDSETLGSIPGISTKIANQICSELSSRYPNFKGLKGSVMSEVVESLKVLGYSARQISLGLKTVENFEKATEDIISEIIRNVSLI